MVRVIASSESCRDYLIKCANKKRLITGLIMGQTTEAKENVIHLARTPEEKGPESESENSISSAEVNHSNNLLDVSEGWVADHAKHVTRMLPGGMYVQGIFITSSENIFDNPILFNKIRSILNNIQKVLDGTPYMFGNPKNIEERLVLHMSSSTKEITCKSLSLSAKTLNPVEWKFMNGPIQWQRLNCYYEFDEIYPVIVRNNGISVKQQFQQILESAYKTMETSLMFFDGDFKNHDQSLDYTQKKTKSKTSKSDVLKPIQVSLFVPFENTMADSVEYMECDGSIHFSGIISSCVFMSPKASVKEAISAVKQDIVRSLASRFTMHCDALIDDNLLPEEKVCFNEPPRRVLVPVGSLYLCDYLFPGESPSEALLSVKELLDVSVTESDVVCDVETPADTSEFDALHSDVSSEESLPTPQEANQFMYITGIGFALLVLIISALVRYFDTITTIAMNVVSK